VENPIAVKRFIQMHLERNKSQIKKTPVGFTSMPDNSKPVPGRCRLKNSCIARSSWVLSIYTAGSCNDHQPAAQSGPGAGANERCNQKSCEDQRNSLKKE
jgi:hypothetical protein